MSKVYYDLDDTLVDFTGGLEIFNTKHGGYKVQDCMNTPGFFEDMPIKKGAKNLWNLAKGNRAILTAWPHTCIDKNRVSDEKLNWCVSNLGLEDSDEFIYCAREDKVKYANIEYTQIVGTEPVRLLEHKIKSVATKEPNILIDDLLENTETWTKAGGIAILFKTMEQSTDELSYWLNKDQFNYYDC